MSCIETEKYKIRQAIDAYEKHILKKFENEKSEAIDYTLGKMEKSYRFWHKNLFGVKFPTREDAIAASQTDEWEFETMKSWSLSAVKTLKSLCGKEENENPKTIFISSDDAWILNWIPK